MGSLDEDPVFELVDPPATENGQEPTGEVDENEDFLDAQDGTDRVE